MEMFFQQYGQAAKTAFGFFWKAGWAFVLGYSVSAMIQVFVPKSRLTRYMGDADVKSVSLSTLFGSISSSCSFAALSAARALLQKGAHFISIVAFMFASTNLVIELGILILIFLGWQFLVAEIIGGLILITISSLLIKWTYPKKWIEDAKNKVEEESEQEEEDFDWKKRITSKEGWLMVGHRFVMEWKMVWQEILIGFTIAGFMAVFVPKSLWAKIFLSSNTDPGNFLLVLENALVAPFVAALTFIGSMGNIPLATVLNTNDVLFAGIMGFIYSDLMVPPLVKVNIKYYGAKVGFYIAGIMFASIVLTAVMLHYLFLLFDILPQSAKTIQHMTQFELDYTFYLNVLFVVISSIMIFFHFQHMKKMEHDRQKKAGKRIELSAKNIIVGAFILILAGGLFSLFWAA